MNTGSLRRSVTTITIIRTNMTIMDEFSEIARKANELRNELEDSPKEPRLPELGPKDVNYAEDGLEGMY